MNIKFCENCGKEHDGSYASGRFCSKSCSKSFIAKQVKNHKNNLPNSKIDYLNKLHTTNLKEKRWQCSHCGECFRTRNLLLQHTKEKHASFDENGKRLAWNKGLTCETSKAMKQLVAKKIKRYKDGELISPFKGRHHSSETKKKISESRKRYLAENPDKVPYRLNHKSKGESYPEKYFREWLEKENIQFNQEFKFGVYSFDFLINGLIDLEIDGSQHYVDKRINSSDMIRDKQTEAAGFKVYRINWSEYQQLENKKSFLSDLKDWIKDTSKKFPVINIQ